MKNGVNDTVTYDERKVVERYGFETKLLPDFKGLKGDPSDNIIGISGIGDKTASILVQKFGVLENILGLARRNPEKLKAAGIKERIIGLLKEKEEDALFSRELATIKKDVPLEFSLSDCAFKSFDSIKIEALFRELGFMSLLARINPGKDRPVAKNETMTMEFSEDSLGKSSTFYWAEHEGKIYIVSGIGEISEMIASNSLNAKTRRAYDAKKIMHHELFELPVDI
ncbi:MAG: 5'-3' exonuclease H3TH domain-containing protein, partial [Patescibacteria group bacterium]